MRPSSAPVPNPSYTTAFSISLSPPLAGRAALAPPPILALPPTPPLRISLDRRTSQEHRSSQDHSRRQSAASSSGRGLDSRSRSSASLDHVLPALPFDSSRSATSASSGAKHTQHTSTPAALAARRESSATQAVRQLSGPVPSGLPASPLSPSPPSPARPPSPPRRSPLRPPPLRALHLPSPERQRAASAELARERAARRRSSVLSLSLSLCGSAAASAFGAKGANSDSGHGHEHGTAGKDLPAPPRPSPSPSPVPSHLPSFPASIVPPRPPARRRASMGSLAYLASAAPGIAHRSPGASPISASGSARRLGQPGSRSAGHSSAAEGAESASESESELGFGSTALHRSASLTAATGPRRRHYPPAGARQYGVARAQAQAQAHAQASEQDSAREQALERERLVAEGPRSASAASVAPPFRRPTRRPVLTLLNGAGPHAPPPTSAPTSPLPSAPSAFSQSQQPSQPTAPAPRARKASDPSAAGAPSYPPSTRHTRSAIATAQRRASAAAAQAAVAPASASAPSSPVLAPAPGQQRAAQHRGPPSAWAARELANGHAHGPAGPRGRSVSGPAASTSLYARAPPASAPGYLRSSTAAAAVASGVVAAAGATDEDEGAAYIHHPRYTREEKGKARAPLSPRSPRAFSPTPPLQLHVPAHTSLGGAHSATSGASDAPPAVAAVEAKGADERAWPRVSVGAEGFDILRLSMLEDKPHERERERERSASPPHVVPRQTPPRPMGARPMPAASPVPALKLARAQDVGRAADDELEPIDARPGAHAEELEIIDAPDSADTQFAMLPSPGRPPRRRAEHPLFDVQPAGQSASALAHAADPSLDTARRSQQRTSADTPPSSASASTSTGRASAHGRTGSLNSIGRLFGLRRKKHGGSVAGLQPLALGQPHGEAQAHRTSVKALWNAPPGPATAPPVPGHADSEQQKAVSAQHDHTQSADAAEHALPSPVQAHQSAAHSEDQPLKRRRRQTSGLRLAARISAVFGAGSSKDRQLDSVGRFAGVELEPPLPAAAPNSAPAVTPESATPRRSLSQRIKSMSQDVLGRNHRRGPSEAIDLRGGLVAAEISAPFQLGPTRRDLPFEYQSDIGHGASKGWGSELGHGGSEQWESALRRDSVGSLPRPELRRSRSTSAMSSWSKARRSIISTARERMSPASPKDYPSVASPRRLALRRSRGSKGPSASPAPSTPEIESWRAFPAGATRLDEIDARTGAIPALSLDRNATSSQPSEPVVIVSQNARTAPVEPAERRQSYISSSENDTPLLGYSKMIVSTLDSQSEDEAKRLFFRSPRSSQHFSTQGQVEELKSPAIIVGRYRSDSEDSSAAPRRSSVRPSHERDGSAAMSDSRASTAAPNRSSARFSHKRGSSAASGSSTVSPIAATAPQRPTVRTSTITVASVLTVPRSDGGTFATGDDALSALDAEVSEARRITVQQLEKKQIRQWASSAAISQMPATSLPATAQFKLPAELEAKLAAFPEVFTAISQRAQLRRDKDELAKLGRIPSKRQRRSVSQPQYVARSNTFGKRGPRAIKTGPHKRSASASTVIAMTSPVAEKFHGSKTATPAPAAVPDHRRSPDSAAQPRDTAKNDALTKPVENGRQAVRQDEVPASKRASTTRRFRTLERRPLPFSTAEEAALAMQREEQEREERRAERERKQQEARTIRYADKKRRDPLLAARLALVGLDPPAVDGSHAPKSATRSQFAAMPSPSAPSADAFDPPTSQREGFLTPLAELDHSPVRPGLRPASTQKQESFYSARAAPVSQKSASVASLGPQLTNRSLSFVTAPLDSGTEDDAGTGSDFDAVAAAMPGAYAMTPPLGNAGSASPFAGLRGPRAFPGPSVPVRITTADKEPSLAGSETPDPQAGESSAGTTPSSSAVAAGAWPLPPGRALHPAVQLSQDGTVLARARMLSNGSSAGRTEGGGESATEDLRDGAETDAEAESWAGAPSAAALMQLQQKGQDRSSTGTVRPRIPSELFSPDANRGTFADAQHAAAASAGSHDKHTSLRASIVGTDYETAALFWQADEGGTL